MPKVSYCVVVFRALYARLLLEQLRSKTSVSHEILIWLNIEDPAFEAFVASVPNARVVGKSPENIGMQGFKPLFSAARGDLVVQFDDDVVAITMYAAEIAADIFERHKNVGIVGAHVWQDALGNGGRPPLALYGLVDPVDRLFRGPIDGGFTFYSRDVASDIHKLRNARYMGLGVELVGQAGLRGLESFLTDRIMMFHVNTPAYHQHYGMLDLEIEKYRLVERQDMVDLLVEAKKHLPNSNDVTSRIMGIHHFFKTYDGRLCR